MYVLKVHVTTYSTMVDCKQIAYFSHIIYVFKAMSMIFFPNLVTIAQFKGFFQSVNPCTYTP